ncbi:MAG TPA: inositol monophosphatase family protein [Candidatus Limnocylindrales bacterium]|nr:inositol monophosphatase family protein [Candidatus Limnocylindrales bacterium]
MSGAASLPFGPEWSASLRRGADAELRGWVDAALGWCDAADALALGHFRADPVTTRKPDRSFVTEADTAVERLLRERIADAFPGHGVVGEEYGDDGGGAPVRWFIDPIDGTHNYLRGVPIWATLLGVERDGELQAGIMSAPALGGRWFAWRGGGAWAVEPGAPLRRLQVSAIDDLGEASISTASIAELESSGLAPGSRRLLEAVWRDRGYGDFWAYALVAGGALDAMFEIGLSIWDAAAPVVLIEEAGGRVTDFEGRRIFDSGTTLATNGVLHDRVRRLLVDRTDGGASR